jgi:hypothetical protein
MDDQKQNQETVTETTTQTTPTQQTTQSVETKAEGPNTSGFLLAQRITYFFLGVIEVLLLFRLILALFGANRDNPFASFVFDTSAVFAAPFFTLFNYEPSYGVSVLELGTMIGMAVYAVVAAGIIALLRIPSRSRV